MTALRTQVVDGANGYIGSNLIHHLVRRGHRVVGLARHDEAAVRSIVETAVIGDVEPDPFDHSLLEVVPYTLLDEQLSLDDEALARVFAEPCDFWHVAASLKYQPGNSGELMAVNVDGSRNTLECVSRHAPAGSRYFLVGTAYSCGLDDDVVREEWHEDAPPSAFRNYYEYSKRLGELVFRDYLDRGAVTGALLRLGPIVGDSRSLRTSNSYGLYQFLDRISRIAKRYPGERVRIVGHPQAALNFLPVDHCIRWMAELADNGVETLEPPIVHILDSGAVPVPEAFTHLNKRIGLLLELIGEPGEGDEPLTQLENLLRAGMAFTGRYVDRPGMFDDSNFSKLLGERPTQVMTMELLDDLMGWFLNDMEENRERYADRRSVRMEQEVAAMAARKG